jgi:hypothetical protein
MRAGIPPGVLNVLNGLNVLNVLNVLNTSETVRVQRPHQRCFLKHETGGAPPPKQAQDSP